MSWKEWAAVGVVIGVGILWQMPRHEPAPDRHAHAAAHDHGRSAAGAAAVDSLNSPYRTVALEVTGMT